MTVAAEHEGTTELIPAWKDGVLVPVEKLEVHRSGLRHKAVSVFVMQGDQVLIQRRALSKYHTPGLWANTCCTHPLWDEAPADCAIRRLREEMGFRNVRVMVPFCRTPEEADRVLAVMAGEGLKRGENGLEVLRVLEAAERSLRNGGRVTPVAGRR